MTFGTNLFALTTTCHQKPSPNNFWLTPAKTFVFWKPNFCVKQHFEINCWFLLARAHRTYALDRSTTLSWNFRLCGRGPAGNCCFLFVATEIMIFRLRPKWPGAWIVGKSSIISGYTLVNYCFYLLKMYLNLYLYNAKKCSFPQGYNTLFSPLKFWYSKNGDQCWTTGYNNDFDHRGQSGAAYNYCHCHFKGKLSFISTNNLNNFIEPWWHWVENWWNEAKTVGNWIKTARDWTFVECSQWFDGSFGGKSIIVVEYF